MKKTLLLISIIMLSFSLMKANAQDDKDKISIQKWKRSTHTDSTVILEGNASISTEKLTIANAEKIVVEKVSNKITVFGSCDFTFSGKIVRTSKNENQPALLEYIPGADMVYIK